MLLADLFIDIPCAVIVLQTFKSDFSQLAKYFWQTARYVLSLSHLTDTEKYPRGRRGSPAKGVVRETVARVQIPLSPPSLTSTNHRVCWGLLLGAARGMLLAAAFPFPLFFAPHTFSSHPYFAACEVHACAARQYIVSLSPIGARCKANPSFSANQILNRTPKSGLGFSLLKNGYCAYGNSH